MTAPQRPALDDSAAQVLELVRAAGRPPLQESTPEQARQAHEASGAALSGPGEPVAEVRADVLGAVPVRRYVPAGARGTTVWVHGGGWVTGTLDTYDGVCRALAAASGTQVVSVGYDLAPERRHPHQVQQVLAVLRALSADGRPALAGDSAGAHLSVLAASLAAAQGLAPAALGLVYPVVSPALDTASARENATGYYLETEGMRWYWEHYLPQEPTDVPVDAAAVDLAALPPTWLLTAGYDPLRDEGRALGDALERAGVPVERVEHPGQLHGFVRFTRAVPESRDAIASLAAFLARHAG